MSFFGGGRQICNQAILSEIARQTAALARRGSFRCAQREFFFPAKTAA